MQFRWIALGTVILSAALVSACGGNATDASLSGRSASTMSKSDGRYTSSGNDDDDCDDSDHHNSSSSMQKQNSKNDDSDECKDEDEHHKSSSSHSLSMSSSKGDKDKDHDGDDDDCKVTICHIPPGNHCAEHEIRVDKSAMTGHIEHGDYPGKCDVQPPPPPPPPPPACGAVDQPCCVVVGLPDPICLAGLSCGGLDGNTCVGAGG
jgi:hypothetical protein